VEDPDLRLAMELVDFVARHTISNAALKDLYNYIKDKYVDGSDNDDSNDKRNKNDGTYGEAYGIDHTSPQAFSEFLFAYNNVIIADIVNNIVKFEKYFAIMMDESTDNGGWGEVAFFLRMWDSTEKK
jgi:hypothetical protein